MNVPLLDLKAQFQPLRAEIMEEVQSVCDEQGFILGPRVAAFEESVARYIGSRYARDRMLHRGLGLRHDQKVHSGTYEAHQRPSVGLRWGRRTRDNHSSPHRGWESDRSILSMKSPKETR